MDLLTKYKLKGVYGFVDRLRSGMFGIFQKYPDVTNQFYEEFLPAQANDIDGCFSLMCVAQKRFGKTLFNMGVADVLMKNPERTLCVWDAPPLAEMISRASGWGDRVYTTDKLHEVKNYSIIYIDEGLTKFNGKRALTKLSRKFGEALTYTSHKSIIILASAQTTGMIKDLRDKCEIVVYGRLPRPFLTSSSNDKFLQEEFNSLVKLSKEKVYILSSAFGFIPEHEYNTEYERLRAAFGLKKNESVGIGVILGDKRKRCSWFTDEVSHNMVDESLDTDLERSLRDNELLEEALRIIFDKFELHEIEKVPKRMLKGYFLRNYQDKYQQLHDASLWEKLFELMSYDVMLLQKEIKELEEQKTEEVEQQIIEVEDGLWFPEYCRIVTEEKTGDGLTGEIIYQLLCEVSMHQIAANLNISSSTVNKKIKEWRNKELGYLWEKWFASKMGGGEVGGSIAGKPDFIDKDGKIYSLKAYYHNQGSVTFYQTKDFNPEYTEALKRKTTYTIVYLNPVWKIGGAIMIEMDPKADERLVIKKPTSSNKITYTIFPTYKKEIETKDENK